MNIFTFNPDAIVDLGAILQLVFFGPIAISLFIHFFSKLLGFDSFATLPVWIKVLFYCAWIYFTIAMILFLENGYGLMLRKHIGLSLSILYMYVPFSVLLLKFIGEIKIDGNALTQTGAILLYAICIVAYIGYSLLCSGAILSI